MNIARHILFTVISAVCFGVVGAAIGSAARCQQARNYKAAREPEATAEPQS